MEPRNAAAMASGLIVSAAYASGWIVAAVVMLPPDRSPGCVRRPRRRHRVPPGLYGREATWASGTAPWAAAPYQVG